MRPVYTPCCRSSAHLSRKSTKMVVTGAITERRVMSGDLESGLVGSAGEIERCGHRLARMSVGSTEGQRPLDYAASRVVIPRFAVE